MKAHPQPLTAISGFHMDFINHNLKHGRMQRNDHDIENINLSRINDKDSV